MNGHSNNKIQHSNQLSSNSLGVFDIVFLVLAAVAPLTSMVVITAIAIALGNGGGMVGSFIIVTLAILCFGIGYAQMSKKLVNAGGFYAFVLAGLGRSSAMSAALLAMFGYNFFVAGATGTSGFFLSLSFKAWFDIDIHWFIWSIISVAIVFVLTIKGIKFSAKILAVFLILETMILLIFDLSVLFKSGFTFEVFNINNLFTSGLGLGLLFAANCFIGIEATGLFSEEAKDPQKTIPKSIYIAILFIGFFSAFTVWAIISAIGVESAKNIALQHLDKGDLVFFISNKYLGPNLTFVMEVLLQISLFAALLALHNSATRYIYALARVKIIPHVLSKTTRNGTPILASFVQLLFALLVAAIFAVLDLEPISTLTPSMTGLGTLGIIALQVMAAVAIICYFRKNKDVRIFKTFIFPLIGGVALLSIEILAIFNFPVMTGSDNYIIGQLPWLIIFGFIWGFIYAYYLKKYRPSIYENLSINIEEINYGSYIENENRDVV